MCRILQYEQLQVPLQVACLRELSRYLLKLASSLPRHLSQPRRIFHWPCLDADETCPLGYWRRAVVQT